MVIFTFCFSPDIHFLTNLVEKFKIVCLKQNLLLFEYVEINRGVHFIYFRLEIHFLGKSDQKN